MISGIFLNEGILESLSLGVLLYVLSATTRD